jgi:type IV secretory pathway VirB4 component
MEGMAVIQREVFLSDIYIEMKGNDKSEKAMDIARRLESYVGKGAMAGFFDGKTSYDMNARLVCWETAELAASGPHLLAAVVGAMIQKVLNHVQEPSRRGNQRMLVLEEFWQLLKVDLVAETVENMYRTSRKFGLAVGIVTQSIEDLTGPPGASGPEFKIGQAIINAANHRMILMQPQNIIANTERTLAWPMEKRWMLSTVRSKKDAFSEIMYECNDTGMCDVMRLIPYPFLMWMSTTANDAVRYRDRTMREILAEDKTKTPTEALAMAIERCSKQFPNGMS